MRGRGCPSFVSSSDWPLGRPVLEKGEFQCPQTIVTSKQRPSTLSGRNRQILPSSEHNRCGGCCIQVYSSSLHYEAPNKVNKLQLRTQIIEKYPCEKHGATATVTCGEVHAVRRFLTGKGGRDCTARGNGAPVALHSDTSCRAVCALCACLARGLAR